MSVGILIHAPREGSDKRLVHVCRLAVQFLSTLPARGATVVVVDEVGLFGISIHAPREGSDIQTFAGDAPALKDFYPRSPRGERQNQTAYRNQEIEFLSTLPARGATCRCR